MPKVHPRPPRSREIPVALTIAGSDSGGGAGIQADLKTFSALDVHGTSAVTCITAQNPTGVFGVQATSAKLVAAQIQAVFEALVPRAIKTGMLYSATIIRAVADALPSASAIPLVVDPVMIATSGASLLRSSANRALLDRLFPRSALITPNLDEARHLVGEPLDDIEDLRRAARWLHSRFGCAVLAKGGHLRGPEAADIFWDGSTELLLSAPRISGVSSHGTGCTYSAAITAHLARGTKLGEAVIAAKEYISRALEGTRRVGRHDVLEHISFRRA